MATYHQGFDSGRMLGVTPEEEIARALQMHSIEFEERISTIDRPLILENAYPGWQRIRLEIFAGRQGRSV
jgi:hypothetical protein